MTERWLIALFIAGLFGGNALADCVPSPDTPASVIEYFKSFNKPLPEQFCAKEDAAPIGDELARLVFHNTGGIALTTRRT
jgi:hypothetical protein